MTEQFEITLSDAAQRLGMSWGRAWRLVLTGKLLGTKREGRWVVSERSVTRLRDAQKKRSTSKGGPVLDTQREIE